MRVGKSSRLRIRGAGGGIDWTSDDVDLNSAGLQASGAAGG